MITFGIVTNSKHHSTNNIDRVNLIIDSIEAMKIPEYEIVIVGDNAEKIDRKKVLPIIFNDEEKTGWITKKKNLITKAAKYENIVYQHDYITYDKKWYKGWENFGFSHWDVAINVIVNKDGTRFRDWCVFDFDGNVGGNGVWNHTMPNGDVIQISPYIPSYLYRDTRNLYISGSYWLAKKSVMEKEPLDESFVWGQPEDIEWSKRVLYQDIYSYKINTLSKVYLLNQKDNVWKPLFPHLISRDYIAEFNDYYWYCRKLGGLDEDY